MSLENDPLYQEMLKEKKRLEALRASKGKGVGKEMAVAATSETSPKPISVASETPRREEPDAQPPEDDSYWNKSPNAAAPHGNADATPYYSPPPAPEVDDTLVDEVPPAVAPGDSGAPAEAVAPGDSEVVQVPGNEGTGLTDEDALFGAETPTPPSFLSEQAADQRLRRIMTPRSNGSLKVPAQLVEQYEKNKDDERFIAKVTRIYQKIEEFAAEDNYEFYSEQDMVDAGWSERKIKGAKKHCDSKPGFTRKSEYGEGTLYWVIISQKGQRKTTTRNIFEKTMEEDASDNEIPQVPGSVGSVNLACTMASVSTPGPAGESCNASPGDEPLDESEDDDDGFNHEAKLLKQVAFPPGMERGDIQPSSLVIKVSKAIGKRLAKLGVHQERLASPINETQGKLLDKVKNLTKDLTEKDEKIGELYSAGLVNGFNKGLQKNLRTLFEESRKLAIDAVCIDSRVSLAATKPKPTKSPAPKSDGKPASAKAKAKGEAKAKAFQKKRPSGDSTETPVSKKAK
ncbi:unnamed protein product [Cladocopium goreaui]|uniref:Uncharacterized protein n=2 Tax=Cladocopium goreaui TaxID=2562237 RepID=A0A9P1BXI9_9DINO|nr:unnamed protein product [Cladocopium goreaui]